VERGTRRLSPQFAITEDGGAYPFRRRVEFAPEPVAGAAVVSAQVLDDGVTVH
jgi:hypothetical protein